MSLVHVTVVICFGTTRLTIVRQEQDAVPARVAAPAVDAGFSSCPRRMHPAGHPQDQLPSQDDRGMSGYAIAPLVSGGPVEQCKAVAGTEPGMAETLPVTYLLSASWGQYWIRASSGWTLTLQPDGRKGAPEPHAARRLSDAPRSAAA